MTQNQSTNWRELCNEILELLDYYIPQDDRVTCWDSWRDRTRAALAEPVAEAVRPSQRQLIMLADDMGMASVSEAAEYARAVLARYGHQPAPAAEGEVE